ncbi:MAG: glutamine--fructose-6-phosphate transaminase (isomerizing) [Lewinellaceae bacterium]|nr:glutamine--fructose-6-phosphate transaminase (isomerizing) [Saprospiraceae bacterium]MCB9314577.1 glutamine--fructose-6-phosphate transaminase (isomerizing) [Lewinellaceae bacterium]MCB9332586.1 glutamine--fructose-6-phosphate transaminase (isomerizing) [Lewinellaceae bacterium]
MCGIVAYIGSKEAYPIIMKGLHRLEYRGYDSAGVALQNGTITVLKKKGKVADLEQFTQGKNISGTSGIGHTRWATHGKPDDTNAHPHTSGNERLVLIHNGIIENYAVLKSALIKHGHTFKSETDTEVLVHLIEEVQQRENLQLEEAVRQALTQVHGAYAIVVMDREDPNKLVAARKSSPLVLGIGKNEFLIASDATPIVEHTKKVVYLNDEEVATVTRDNQLLIKTLRNEIMTPTIQEIELEIEQLEKGGYDYFMLKEIFEQPATIAECMRGRMNEEEGWVRLGGMEEYKKRMINAQRMIILGCGTSWHAGMIAEYLFEDLARLPVEVEYASEFRYRNPVVREQDIVLAISQSGETADTHAALELAKERGAITYGIVNVVGSSIARLTHSGSYIHVGPEIGVASTKAFTGQVTMLTLMALILGYERGFLGKSQYQKLVQELALIPGKIQQLLDNCQEQVKYIAGEFKDATNALYLGRGYNFPVALEGALKLKEISYIHAEGYPAAEMKHGPIALIDENMPVFVIATNLSAYDKIVSNIQEVKARKGVVVAVVTEGDQNITKLADYTIEIPATEEPLTPLLSVVPMQLLAYHIALLRGCNVDQPRNLAKSVTVE